MRCRVRSRPLISLLLCTAALGLFLGKTLNLSGPWQRFWDSRECSCSKCLTEGKPCLADLIGEAPYPFLSKEHPISYADFKWWKPIQGEKRNFTFYNETVAKVFEVFPTFATLQGPSPERCRSCAVVGNSGILRGSHQGPLIDAHNIVIRINRGRTEGYEADVGTKTTHRVMYPESRTGLDNATYLLFFPFKGNDFLWLMGHFRPDESEAAKSKRIANKDMVTVINPAFMRYSHESWLGSVGHYPSTGFMAIVLSMFMCDEVRVFGFGANQDGNWDHYFEILKNKKLKTGGHPGIHEYKTIELLHKRNIIQFIKRL